MQKFEEEFVDFVTEMFASFGMDKLSSKLVALLYIEPKELSMDQLSKITGYCKASILNKTRMLEGTGIIVRRKKPGTKKVFFYMDKDLLRIMKRKYEMAYQKEIIPVKENVPRIIAKYKNAKMSEKDKKKMKIIKDYYKQMLKIEKMFDKLHLIFAEPI